jgi:hypothetical protein
VADPPNQRLEQGCPRTRARALRCDATQWSGTHPDGLVVRGGEKPLARARERANKVRVPDDLALDLGPAGARRVRRAPRKARAAARAPPRENKASSPPANAETIIGFARCAGWGGGGGLVLDAACPISTG